MDSGDGKDKLTSERVTQIAVQKSNTFDNLASDSLKILNIQLFFIPVTISVLSVSISVITATSGDPNSVGSIAENLSTSETSRIVLSASILLGVVLATTVIYYYCRKTSQREINYLINSTRENPREYLESKDFGGRQEKLHNLSQYISGNKSSDYYEDQLPETRYKSSIGRPGSPENLARILLWLSLIATLASASVIINEIAGTVDTGFEILGILAGILGISFAAAMLYVGFIFEAVESVVRWAFVNTSYLLFSLIEPIVSYLRCNPNLRTWSWICPIPLLILSLGLFFSSDIVIYFSLMCMVPPVIGISLGEAARGQG